ncbi:MAG: hypothetical protein AAGA99_11635 [Actinomycetota bacterium]
MLTTAKQFQADEALRARLDEGLVDYLRRLRVEDALSWDRIARRLLVDTEGLIDVTDSTMSNWFDQLVAPEMASHPASDEAATGAPSA